MSNVCYQIPINAASVGVIGIAITAALGVEMDGWMLTSVCPIYLFAVRSLGNIAPVAVIMEAMVRKGK